MGLARLESNEQEAVKKIAASEAEDGEDSSLLSFSVDDTLDAALDNSLRPIQAGYLWKLSEVHEQEGSLRWIKRWFVLRADACLYFFKTDDVSTHSSANGIDVKFNVMQAVRPLGAILLSGCQVAPGSSADPSRQNSLTLKWPSRKSSRPQLSVSAENEDELRRWMNVMARCAQNPDQVKKIITKARNRRRFLFPLLHFSLRSLSHFPFCPPRSFSDR